MKRLLRLWLNRIDTKPVTCSKSPKVPFAVTRHIFSCPVHFWVSSKYRLCLKPRVKHLLPRHYNREDAYSRAGGIVIRDTAGDTAYSLWFSGVWPYVSLNHNKYAVSRAAYRMKKPPVRDYASSLTWNKYLTFTTGWRNKKNHPANKYWFQKPNHVAHSIRRRTCHNLWRVVMWIAYMLSWFPSAISRSLMHILKAITLNGAS